MKKLQSLTILLGLSIIFGGTLSVLAQTKFENVSEKEALNNENDEKIDKQNSKKIITGQLDYIFDDETMDVKNFKEGGHSNESLELEGEHENMQLIENSINKSKLDGINNVQVTYDVKGNNLKNIDELINDKNYICLPVDSKDEKPVVCFLGKKPLKTVKGPKLKAIINKANNNKTGVNHAVAMVCLAEEALSRLEEKEGKISQDVKKEILDIFSSSCLKPDILFKKISTPGVVFCRLSEEGYRILKMVLTTINEIVEENKTNGKEISEDIFNLSKQFIFDAINLEIKNRKEKCDKVVVRPDLLKKEGDGSVVPIDGFYEKCREQGLEDKIIVEDEEAAAIFKKQQGISDLDKAIKEVQQSDFKKVKTAAGKFKCREDLRDKNN